MAAWWIRAVLLLAVTPAFAASDYAREARWADEITPAILVGDPVRLTQKNGHRVLALYAPAAGAGPAVVLAHGIGVHPDWGLIGSLRQRLPDLGYATLSVQMPVLAADAQPEAYAATFPEAEERLQLAVDYLKAQGHAPVALVSHSLGSRMSLSFMRRHPADVERWAALGMGAADASYEGVRAPVLDLYGARDLPPVLAGAARRRASLEGRPGSKQLVIPAADHFFADREDEMIDAVKRFLDAGR